MVPLMMSVVEIGDELSVTTLARNSLLLFVVGRNFMIELKNVSFTYK